jgi:hypothetical protein
MRVARASQISYGWSQDWSTTVSVAVGQSGQAGRLRSSQLQLSRPMATPSYTEPHILAYPVEYLAGIDLYNAGEFHAAHDAWEERWMGPVAPDEKLFLQAMIQSAVAFHHLQIGRPGAARQMYLAAKEKFGRLGCKVFMSLDLEEYQAQLDRALSWLTSVPDPREIEQPPIEPPVIRLIAAVDAETV